MATGYISTQENTNFAKFSWIIVDLCRDLLFEILGEEISPANLPSEVSANLHKLKLSNEQTKKILNKPAGVPPNARDVDISVIYTLMRNICLKFPQPTQGWGRPPLALDTKISDDVERIRFKRNLLFGHCYTAAMSDREFKQELSDLKNVVLRLDNYLQSKQAAACKSFSSGLNAIEQSSMDPVQEQRYVEAIKRQQEEDKKTRELLSQFKTEQEKELKDVQSGVTKLREETKAEVQTLQDQQVQDKKETMTKVQTLQDQQERDKEETTTKVQTLQDQQERDKEETTTKVQTLQDQQEQDKEETTTKVQTLQDQQERDKEETMTKVQTLQDQQVQDKEEIMTKVQTLQDQQERDKEETMTKVQTLQDQQVQDKEETMTKVQTLQDQQELDKEETMTKVQTLQDQQVEDKEEITTKVQTLQDQQERDKEETTTKVQTLQDQQVRDKEETTTKVQTLQDQQVRDKDETMTKMQTLQHQQVLDKEEITTKVQTLQDQQVRDKEKTTTKVQTLQDQQVRDKEETTKKMQTLQDQQVRDKEETTTKMQTLQDEQQRLTETVADIQREAEVRRELESLSLEDQTQSQADLYQDGDEAIVQSCLYQMYKDEMILDVSPIPSFGDIPLSEVFTPIVIREDLEATLTLEARKSGGNRSADTGQSSEPNNPMESYEDMFYKNGKSQKNVYLLGKAGSGKTTFCCHLVSVWCKSLGTAHYKNPEVIHSFDFVFLVFCREAGETQKVLEMIMEQLFPGPDNKYQEFVKNLLQTKPEKCLVIIDGLDEWAGSPTVRTSRRTPSGLPDKKGLENCVVLTTSRPWRIEALRQGVGPLYRIMEIQGLTRKGIKKLTKKIVKARHDSETTENRRKLVANFIRSVRKAKLSSVVKTPLMLVNVFTLWHECQSLDTSVCVNYSKMIESLLLHAKGESGRSDDCNRLADHPQLGRLKAEWARSEQQLPQSFNSLENCQIYGPLIFKLARLAFDGLFHERKEMSLVFSRPDLERYFQNSEIEVILKLGILSTAAAHSKSRERLSTVSFLHKTLQEFLAALWMSVDSCADCLSVFSKHCKCVADVNDLSVFLVFLCGLSPDKGREVWRYIGEVTAVDPAVQEYRTEAAGRYEVSSKPPLQQLLLQCTAEAIQHRPDMPLNYNIQDVYVDRGISVENLGLLLGHAVGSDTGIKTLVMSGIKPSPEILETINRMVSLECLVIQSPPEHSDPKQLCEVIFTAVNSLSPVTSLKLTEMSIAAPNRLFTVQLPQMLKSLTLRHVSITGRMQVSWPVTMETLHMTFFTLDHDSVLQLATWLQGSSSLQELCIGELKCRDCGYSCLDPLDVTRHTRLHSLELQELSVDRVQVTPSNLETVVLVVLYKPGAAGSVISCLNLAPQLTELTVRHCTLSQSDKSTLCSVLPRLSQLVWLELGEINCDDLAVCVSDLSRFRKIELWSVTMSDQAWSKFARSLPPTSHQLTVKLLGVTMSDQAWSKFACSLPATSHQLTVKLEYVTMSDQAWSAFARSLPATSHQLTVELFNVNIDAATVSYIAAHFTVTRDDVSKWRWPGDRVLYFHSREQT